MKNKLKIGDFVLSQGFRQEIYLEKFSKSPLPSLGRQSSESQSTLSSDQLTPGVEKEEEQGYGRLNHSQEESLDDLRDWTGQAEKKSLNNCCSCSVM